MIKLIYCEVNNNHISQYRFAKLLVSKILKKIKPNEIFNGVLYQNNLKHHRFIFEKKYVNDKDLYVYTYNPTITFYYQSSNSKPIPVSLS